VGLASGVAEPEDLERLHTVLLAGRSPLSAVVRAEATRYGLPLPASAEEARSRLVGHAPIDEPVRPADEPRPMDDEPLPPVDLPRRRTGFVGRRSERDLVRRAVTRARCRLLTLLGPAGIGTSRLALQAAHELRREDAFASVRFVRLGASGSVAELPATIIEALGFGPTARDTPLAAAAAVIGRRRLLLVCDVDGHLRGGAESLGHLLDRCPNLTLLAASPERLHLDGERLLRVGGLGYPATVDVAPEAAMCSDAVRLFVRRARRVRPDFVLGPAEVPHVVRLCRAVDGHPLGLELAAAWIRVMPIEEVADAVSHDLDLLASPTRDAPERQRSVRAALEASWRALDASERRLLVRLAVVDDGFGRAAAAAVARASLPALASLVDKSWLRVDATGRYTWHPLVRHFIRAKRGDAPGEVADAVRRHARYFLARGRAARELLAAGPPRRRDRRARGGPRRHRGGARGRRSR
jgi:predicted ATPase